MVKLLVPVDGLETALAAVRYAARLAKDQPGSLIHLLNVQAPIAGSAPAFLGKRPIRLYYEEEGKKALVEASRVLDEAGVGYETHVVVGEPAAAIADYAHEHGFDHIVMARGSGTMARLFGSLDCDLLEHARTPVTFVP
jgi:nucleotide-binding universal stress UspA family protein